MIIRNLSSNTKILIVLVLLITYGSLYPGNFSYADPDSFEQFFTNMLWVTSIGDLLGNIALFLPLGINGGWVIHARYRATHLLLWLTAGFVFALALQILQIWLPTRSATLADVLWNMVGLVSGIGIGFLARRFLSSRSLGKLSPLQTGTILPFVILLLWTSSELLPLVPSLDWQKFKDALKPLQEAPILP